MIKTFVRIKHVSDKGPMNNKYVYKENVCRNYEYKEYSAKKINNRENFLACVSCNLGDVQ